MVNRKIKGGLLVNIGVNVFLPASQVDIRRPSDIGDYIDRTIQCIVLKIDDARRNIVVSRRALIETERAEKKSQLLSTLRQYIGGRLQQGELPLLDTLSPDLEDALGLTSRQLQRRLADQGMNFKDVVEQVRKEQVLHELRHTSLPLNEVARRAAYAEVSSMHRAVRRWTGLTPLAVRQEQNA